MYMYIGENQHWREYQARELTRRCTDHRVFKHEAETGLEKSRRLLQTFLKHRAH